MTTPRTREVPQAPEAPHLREDYIEVWQSGWRAGYRAALLLSEAAPPAYRDSGLPLGTEVYGFLDALDVTWSTFEVEALERFIQGRIDASSPGSGEPTPTDEGTT